jgi:uncharacterized protein YggE
MRGTPLRRIAGILTLGIILLVPSLASAQQGITTGSLTVTGYGQSSGPADLATVYLTIASESAMMGPTAPASSRDRETVAPVVDALVAAGIDEGTISVITGPGITSAMSYFGPAMALIRFDVANPTAASISAAVDAATTAASDARLVIGGMSVRLGSNDCASLERDAREAAITDARARADVMGELAGLLPGETISVRDISLAPESGFIYVNPALTGCSPIQADIAMPDIYGPTAYDLTREPTVTVYAQVEMTFAASPATMATPSG